MKSVEVRIAKEVFVVVGPERVLEKVSSGELVELIRFSAIYGKRWKSKLRDSWAFSSSPRLVGIRNKIGSEGLYKLKFFAKSAQSANV